MERYTTSELMVRLAPRFSEYFQNRGLVDLRVFPNKPETLFIYVHFFCELGEPIDIDVLFALAAEMGIKAERGCRYGHTVWIEVQAAPTRGVVVPFPAARRLSSRLASVTPPAQGTFEADSASGGRG
jgi:hypothetical protein